jgi:hypothetical protein
VVTNRLSIAVCVDALKIITILLLLSIHVVHEMPKFVFVVAFHVQSFCILAEQRMFCRYLSGRESALLQTSVGADWMCAVSSVSFMLGAIDNPTNLM